MSVRSFERRSFNPRLNDPGPDHRSSTATKKSEQSKHTRSHPSSRPPSKTGTRSSSKTRATKDGAHPVRDRSGSTGGVGSGVPSCMLSTIVRKTSHAQDVASHIALSPIRISVPAFGSPHHIPLKRSPSVGSVASIASIQGPSTTHIRRSSSMGSFTSRASAASLLDIQAGAARSPGRTSRGRMEGLNDASGIRSRASSLGAVHARRAGSEPCLVPRSRLESPAKGDRPRMSSSNLDRVRRTKTGRSIEPRLVLAEDDEELTSLMTDMDGPKAEMGSGRGLRGHYASHKVAGTLVSPHIMTMLKNQLRELTQKVRTQSSRIQLLESNISEQTVEGESLQSKQEKEREEWTHQVKQLHRAILKMTADHREASSRMCADLQKRERAVALDLYKAQLANAKLREENKRLERRDLTGKEARLRQTLGQMEDLGALEKERERRRMDAAAEGETIARLFEAARERVGVTQKQIGVLSEKPPAGVRTYPRSDTHNSVAVRQTCDRHGERPHRTIASSARGTRIPYGFCGPLCTATLTYRTSVSGKKPGVDTTGAGNSLEANVHKINADGLEAERVTTGHGVRECEARYDERASGDLCFPQSGVGLFTCMTAHGYSWIAG
ncbi:hypothetical protein BDK51DRAFT_40568 [Blyttiomyces helicus]|uniref:Lebercilin domain-containing protein n=1 Tax=Blyttiomyces helicus TaxID=388810 RepID=A0A4V1IRC5_9FUNG|nr:hypothetical protein BDK51DRAFT_40568 [Blyttiomyces helicus]|eukprot:RKO89577.1 hypothetical protein BDK51DRAFT_40568 [Blyttiomyces helicus]